jgi:hypothetical protein
MKTIHNVKGMTKMNDLNKYIDHCIIDEYATKSLSEGFSLDVDDIPENELSNFLHELMQRDTNVRDYVLHSMQSMINERLRECESTERYESGFQLKHLSNGDTRLQPMRGF